MPKVSWVMLCGFCSKFQSFTEVQKFENWLRFDKVTESLKVRTFLRHSVVVNYVNSTAGLLQKDIRQPSAQHNSKLNRVVVK